MSIQCCSQCETSSRVCNDGVNYVKRELVHDPKKAVIACEGACIKGEVARVAANILAYRLKRDLAVRICWEMRPPATLECWN